MMAGKSGGYLAIRLSAAFCAGLFTSQAMASPTPEEQSIIDTFRNYSQCVESHRPLRLRAEENYQQQLEMRESYIRTRAEELARKRADAAMHIIMGSALSEGMTAEEADLFVENIVQGDARNIEQELGKLVDMPPAPVASTEHCSMRMHIDLPSLNTQVRMLTEKYGQEILQPEAPAPAPASPQERLPVTLNGAPPVLR
jgi:hypothetical protein